MNKNNETKGINLFTKGEIRYKDKNYTKLIGGFGEDKPIMTTNQITELMGYDLRTVNQTIERNMKDFEENIHIVDLKKIITGSDYLLTLGYSKVAVGRKSSKFYGLSEAGFLLYLKHADGERAIELYKDFIEDYFRLRAENKVMETRLSETLKTLNEEANYVCGAMFREKDNDKRKDLFSRYHDLEEQMKKIEITLSKEETAKEFEEIVAVADRVLNSEGLLDFLHFSKVLDIPNMGRNKLFEWMRNKGILMEDNTPYQQHSDHFKVITNDWYGHISTQTFIKPQGIKYIVKKLIEDEKIPSLSYNEIMEKVETLKTLAS